MTEDDAIGDGAFSGKYFILLAGGHNIGQGDQELFVRLKNRNPFLSTLIEK